MKGKKLARSQDTPHGTLTGTQYTFVVETNQYAGNFERKLCAYLTGTIGDCEVGDTEAKLFEEETGWHGLENPFDELIRQEADDSGCRRPCAVGSPITEVEIYFEERPPDDLIELMKQRATAFGKMRKIRIKGFRLVKKEIWETEERLA